VKAVDLARASSPLRSALQKKGSDYLLPFRSCTPYT
jgi:hypothetical protein